MRKLPQLILFLFIAAPAFGKHAERYAAQPGAHPTRMTGKEQKKAPETGR